MADCMMIHFQLGFQGMKLLLIFISLMNTRVNAAAPNWFSDYIKSDPSCEKIYICTVGEGDSLAAASGAANSEMAKFFQNKITAKSEITSTFEQTSDKADSGNFAESSNKIIHEEASEVLKGLEIKKEEQVGNRTYVLMSLDRGKAALMLKDKIEKLDSENFQLMDSNSRFTYPKVFKNLNLIETLNERFILLSNVHLKLKIKKENVQEKIKNLTPVRMGLVAISKKIPTKLNHAIVDLFSSLKIVIVPRKSLPKFTLSAEILTEEQYLKIEGFKRLSVQLRFELKNSKATTLGKISTISEQIARNSDQAIDMAVPELQEQINNSLDQFASIKLNN